MEVTILGTGRSVFKYEKPDHDIWVINRAFLFEQDADVMFLFHTLYDAFHELSDRMAVKYASEKMKVLTSCKNDFIKTEPFPLRQIIETLGISYFRCSVAYALAYAAYMGYEKVNLVGIDYDGPDMEGEKACVEFWIGYLRGRHVEVNISEGSTLLTGLFYGYETTYKFEEDDARRT